MPRDGIKLWISRHVHTRYRPTTLPLPLGTLIYRLDSSTHERSVDLNPDLPDLLGRFAYFLNDPSSFPHGPAEKSIYHKIYKDWIFDYLVKDPSDPSKAKLYTSLFGGIPTYKVLPEFSTTPELFSKIKESVTINGDSAFLIYVGLYFFTAWHFLVDSAEKDVIGFDRNHSDLRSFTGNVLNARARNYLITKALDWEWNGWTTSVVKIRPDFVLQGSDYTYNFLTQARVQGHTLELMRNLLGSLDAYFAPSDVNGKFDATVAKEASIDFVTKFRALFDNILRKEYLDLLHVMTLDGEGGVQNIACHAVGDGSPTNGFFRLSNLGNSFFAYECDDAKSKKYNRYEPLLKKEIPVWAGHNTISPGAVLLKWGANGPSPFVGVASGRQPLYPSITCHDTGSAYLDQTNAGQFEYNARTGILSAKKVGSEQLTLTCSTTDDEVVFFILGFNNPSGFSQFQITPDPRLRIDYLFPDNEFVVPIEKTHAFWTPAWPGVTPQEAAAQEAALTDLIIKMGDHPGFEIDSTVLGQGIGLRIDLSGATDFQSDLIPAENQLDTETADDQALRYAYGEVEWRTGDNGDVDVLRLCTEGFVSSLRCTWASWPQFLNHLVPDGSMTKAAALGIELGSHLRTSSNLPSPFDVMPSYNTALSAFRAFGMMEAMVKRLEDAVDDFPSAQLSPTQKTDIKATLESFLHLQASTVLPQVGLKETTGVTIDYTMFLKYAY